MKKFKISQYKFLFLNKYTKEFSFGNKFDYYSEDTTEEEYKTKRTPLSCYKYKMSWFFQEHKKPKFSESEASILLLKKIEEDLRKAKQNLKKLEKELVNDSSYADNNMYTYGKKVYENAVEENTKNAVIWRKKVKEIKNSKEYMWEQLLK